ncbi:MAG: hypothetical protein CMI31_02640 [Opitutae bacterium]|nr:hypothetical protein [Opitutae bacterium]
MSKAKGQGKDGEEGTGFSDRELQESHNSKQGASSLFLPFFLSLMLFAWLTWGGISISVDANGFALHPDREMTPEELAAREARTKARMAEQLYVTYCGACHQPHGKGIAGTYPPLDGSNWVDNGKRIASMTYVGLIGKIEVLGQVYDNPSGMPAIAKTANLKPEQIASIINYVRGSWSNADKKYPEVSVEEIQASEKELGDRDKPWTPEELLEKYPFGGASE